MNLPLGARLWIADAPKDPKGMILICPGGGYQWLSPREAQPVAHAFAAAGWAAAVVYYTVREKPGQPPLGTLPVRQLGEALQTMQQRFPALSALVCGFSAGGHLAASYGAFWKKKTFLAEELGVDAEQLRPNGLLLSYPVITSGPKAHRGSFTNLLGDRYDELVDEMSLENQVSLDTPKTFLWHTAPDDCVPVENSILFFTALHALEIPVEMHIYPVGGHGLGLASEETQSYEYQNAVREECQSWISLALSWMQHL